MIGVLHHVGICGHLHGEMIAQLTPFSLFQISLLEMCLALNVSVTLSPRDSFTIQYYLLFIVKHVTGDQGGALGRDRVFNTTSLSCKY